MTIIQSTDLFNPFHALSDTIDFFLLFRSQHERRLNAIPCINPLYEPDRMMLYRWHRGAFSVDCTHTSRNGRETMEEGFGRGKSRGAFAKQFHRTKDVCRRGLADNGMVRTSAFTSILHYTRAFLHPLSCAAPSRLSFRSKKQINENEKYFRQRSSS